MDTIVTQALDLWKVEEDRSRAELEREELQARENRIRAGVEFYRNLFGAEPTVNEDGCFLLHCPEIQSDYNPYAPFVALMFSASHGQHLVVLGKCPRCKNALHMGNITQLVDLGAVLSSWDVPYHECDSLALVQTKSPENKLREELEDIELVLTGDEIHGVSTRAWNRLAILREKTRILIAERLRKE